MTEDKKKLRLRNRAIVTELSSCTHPTCSLKMLVLGLRARARECNFFLVYTTL